MTRKIENSGFICVNCSKYVVALTNGGYRNHCPFCLCSLHVDVKIGDRNSKCFGKMKAVKVLYNSKKGYQILHKCMKCGYEKLNKIAEYTLMPDNLDIIISLMNKE